MKFGTRLVLCSALAIVAVGCEGRVDKPNEQVRDRPAANIPATPPAGPTGDVRSMGGELGAVDIEKRTFVVVVDGRELPFRFTDATQVTGASGTQGLAGRKGASVTVYYRDDAGSGNIADRIILSGADAPAAPTR